MLGSLLSGLHPQQNIATSRLVRSKGHVTRETIYRQPVSGNLQEDNSFTFESLHTFLGNHKTLYAKLPMCYQGGPVACTAVGCLAACKSCLL